MSRVVLSRDFCSCIHARSVFRIYATDRFLCVFVRIVGLLFLRISELRECTSLILVKLCESNAIFELLLLIILKIEKEEEEMPNAPNSLFSCELIIAAFIS